MSGRRISKFRRNKRIADEARMLADSAIQEFVFENGSWLDESFEVARELREMQNRMRILCGEESREDLDVNDE